MTYRRLTIAAPALLVAAWFVAVAKYWHDCVPAVRTTVIEPVQATVVIGTTDRHELAMASPSDGEHGRYLTRNPVEFRNLSNGSVTRVFDLEGGFTFPALLGNGYLQIEKDGRLHLYDVESLKLVDTLPEGAKSPFPTGPDRRLTAFRIDDRLTVRDCRKRKDLWSRSGVRSAFSPGYDLIQTREGSEEGDQGVTLLDPLNGERTTLFEHLGPIRTFQRPYSTNAADFVLTKLVDGPFVVCRWTTGERLWSMTDGGNPGFFNDDGSELLDQSIGDSGTTLIRRRSLNGEVIAKTQGLRAGRRNGVSSSTWRYTLISGEFLLFRPAIANAISAVEGWIGAALLGNPIRPGCRLIDTQSCATIANLGEPESQDMPVHIMKDFQGIVRERQGRIEYFECPPKRNWTWLAIWSLLPPLSLVALMKGSKSVIRRRRAQSLPDSP